MNNLSTLEPQYQVVISNYSEAGGHSDTEAVKNGECDILEKCGLLVAVLAACYRSRTSVTGKAETAGDTETEEGVTPGGGPVTTHSDRLNTEQTVVAWSPGV